MQQQQQMQFNNGTDYSSIMFYVFGGIFITLFTIGLIGIVILIIAIYFNTNKIYNYLNIYDIYNPYKLNYSFDKKVEKEDIKLLDKKEDIKLLDKKEDIKLLDKKEEIKLSDKINTLNKADKDVNDIKELILKLNTERLYYNQQDYTNMNKDILEKFKKTVNELLEAKDKLPLLELILKNAKECIDKK
jgi:hypothetical protein